MICKICEKDEQDVKIIKKNSICINCKSKINYEKNKENKLKKCKEYYEKNKEYILDRNRNYYNDNSEEILIRNKEYNKQNSEKIKEYNKEYSKIEKEIERKKKYLLDNKEKEKKRQYLYYLNNKEKVLKRNKFHRDSNKEKYKLYRTEYDKNRSKSDIIYKLKNTISSSIRSSFYYLNRKKNSRTTEILGCSIGEFKIYLESKFEDWMTWENKGLYNGELNYGWDIDHIIPISSAKTEEDIILLNHYTNLQPLCSHINRYIKRDNENF